LHWRLKKRLWGEDAYFVSYFTMRSEIFSVRTLKNGEIKEVN